MRTLYAIATATALMLGAAGAARAAEQSIIVLDASGSMWGQIDGKAKMTIARETLDTVLKSVPSETALGLMVYGHREKGSCADIELAVPPTAGSTEAISAFVGTINPKGKTPLSAAVKQAAEALKYTEEKATVILVTDGLETCAADPCALADELERNGVDFTAHVVGFGLTAEEGKQVACLAENTGGRYLQASDAGELAEALTTTVAEAPPAPEPAPTPEPEPAPVVPPPTPQPPAPSFNLRTDAVLSEGGPSLGDLAEVRWDIYPTAANGERLADSLDGGYDATYETTLPPGRYVAMARLAELSREVPFEVKADEVSEIKVNFEAGILILKPMRTPGGERDESARIDIRQGSFSDGGYGERAFYVPAGDIDIEASIGVAKVTDRASVKAGETVAKDVVIGTGVVVPKAVYAEGGPDVEEDGIRFDVVSVTKDINGEPTAIEGSYGIDRTLDIPAGDFVLKAQLGQASGETPFSVKAGERVEVSVNINGGVLAVTAPGADRIEVVGAKKDIQGRQKDITGNYGEVLNETIPPGDYIVRVSYQGDVAPKEKPASIKAGERTEVTVE
ncbi:VWA domain-containing protein [Agrobacterium sp. a22-2]|uniref:vWA domain-containing protein n=1 Tax=Agrobacterium sp. a22-2 TaxID=2283840 RepID=UPI001FEEB882|nr:VWA domain-containing protein [Agrobacterium sp. a22-2]